MALSSSVYLQSSTTEQTDTNTLDIGGTTTPNKVTILEVTGIFRGVILKWDEQLNLTNFDHYDIQVSDDQVSWYSLKNDGTGWKDTLNGTTTVYVATYTHSRIPLGGTADNPQPVTLYYRVRRVTKVGATGDWSDVAAGVAQAIDSGELAADSVYTNNLRAGIVTAEKIGAGEVTADKIAIGGARKIYNQTLAPNVAYANDIWYDANDTKWTHNLDIISSRGGAPSSVTTFDSTVGGAPSGNTSWGNTYGDIPSRAGWITTLYEGMTAIDGGRIKTDTLKSWNYVEKTTGTKIDLATGEVDINAPDDVGRHLGIGKQGLLVKDANYTVIHDIPDAAIQEGNSYCGHIIWYRDQTSYVIYASSDPPVETWTSVTCISDSNTNVKMGIFQIYMQVNPGGGYMGEEIYLRPYGSQWVANYSNNTPSLAVNTTTKATLIVQGILMCPIGTDNKIEFYYDMAGDSGAIYSLRIAQLGVGV